MASPWEGEWETDFGDMTLKVKGYVLTGTYEYRNGRILGTVAGDIATGIWQQSCSEPHGVPWGRFRLELDGDEVEGEWFEGEWSYGNGPMDGDWEGEKCDDGDAGGRYVA